MVDFIFQITPGMLPGTGRNDFFPTGNDTAHRELAGIQGLFGELQRLTHEMVVIHGELVK